MLLPVHLTPRQMLYPDTSRIERNVFTSTNRRSIDTKRHHLRKKIKVFSSARKVLLTIFWDSGGVVHTEFLEQGNTVNSTKYVNTLDKLKARLRRVRSEKVSIIHHDNARPHTSLETRTALDRLGLRTLLHPPYRPDLAPSDFFFFPKLKDYLKGNRYETDKDVKNAVLSWCRDKTPDFFADGIQQVVRRRRLCIERNDDYFEK
ncbi:histone-lysine N-methyltransferase SETMAR [Elysia marginata]|uniref:Histone-lysine N-methyltransferase SETMAR n=1 Tax=Elysia marginata TaxID=1093978 RepID=A0AAV4GJG5_9GAST|nr:histone-lysine N-methyltransferase SETMAR [Elysia marginata]